jgi:phosphoserine phosphatase RsbX
VSEDGLIEWGVATRVLLGERESGDLYAVARFDGGALVAAVDGLGHGPDAAIAARRAVDVLEAHACEPIASLLHRCHEALRGTRGAVLTLASFAADRPVLSWVGVGNVEGTLIRADPETERPRESVFLVGGVAGHKLPTLRPVELLLAAGDTLVLATDGVRAGHAEALDPASPPGRAAQCILDRYARGNDDALVLVARYRGAGG